jgi:hypothetical protein
MVGGQLNSADRVGRFLLGHALFWPGILRQWAARFRDLAPFLAAHRRRQHRSGIQREHWQAGFIVSCLLSVFIFLPWLVP